MSTAAPPPGSPPGASIDDGLPPLRDVIRAHDLIAKKNLGQNFILDLNLTRRIARLASPLTNTTVIEVGPGPGGLTRALLMEGAHHVIAIERDARCLRALAEISAAYPGRLTVHEGDALETDFAALAASAPGDVAVAANLPYNIATLLLIGWLETEPWPPWWQRMALMFQKEVAERIVAEPGSKAYGRLAVIAQWRAKPRIALTLPPAAFTPPPKVSSAVVVFEPREKPTPECSVKTLGRVTQSAFGQRRKMLRQSLKTLLPMPELLLREAGISPELRAEQLTVEDFARLANIYERGTYKPV
ncbi:MAG: 16S rRNA (adenine(1518)-N(6)/adenine(1519)-N(6))-dimethyltransferase [Hyphomicrobium sp.]|nr:16S rRNA (adenine(1518)-N(6)/adenine(1519)-N(6))-dimethyltransferase [Hyphomicrobium sp.]PPD08292.1 MAG: 16S rRNA (adenine(1518)-N(6)/adenine(1519)-N(6))-dimethyltransferase [Hyphomicrobium sp.]